MAERNRQPAVLAAFERRLDAEQAVDDLEKAGFKHNEVGFVMRGEDVAAGGMITDETGAKDKKGAVTGAATGGVVGGILGAVAALVVPGVGPVLAAGLLASIFGGAAAGVAIGGILGAMVGLDISEEEAQFYQREFEAGRAIVAVKAGPRAAEAARILRRNRGYDIETRPQSPIPTRGPLSEP